MELIQTIAATATAIGIFIAVIQLIYSYGHSITRFEDEVSKEYREIIKPIPTEAILGEELSDDEFKKHLESIFSYIDLSNEEIFLRQRGRVSRKTWDYWRSGILSNMKKPVFKKAWDIIIEANKKHPDNKTFAELEYLLEPENVQKDPRKWGKVDFDQIQERD
ncbi:MAG: hypothetical protein APR54_05160 [Candidatus Cloacimonas sp. SDB]|nr:MAG: hypothetical protein APR54_05160 [Candidatus Cloacimonas sp. SDB]